MARANGTPRYENRQSNGSDEERKAPAGEERKTNGNGGGRRPAPVDNRLDLADLKTKTINELLVLAKNMGLDGVSGLKKQDLIFEIF